MPTDWSKATDDQVLDADLLTELKLTGLPEDEQLQVITKMSETVQEAALLAAFEQLTPEQMKKLKPLIDGEDAEGIRSFLETEIEDFADLTKKELIKYKRAMLTKENSSRAS